MLKCTAAIIIANMRPIGECVTDELQAIFAHAKKIISLNEEVKKNLPENLAKNCKVGDFRQGSLVLNTSNAIWATELRFYLPTLRDKLRKSSNFYNLANIKIIVLNDGDAIKVKNKVKRELSPKARELLKNAGDECNYPPLKKALYKLADFKTIRT